MWACVFISLCWKHSQTVLSFFPLAADSTSDECWLLKRPYTPCTVYWNVLIPESPVPLTSLWITQSFGALGYNQSYFSSYISFLPVTHGVSCQFPLPLSSIYLYLLAYLYIYIYLSISLSLYVSPSLCSELTNASETPNERAPPVNTPRCIPEVTLVIFFTIPPRENAVIFSSPLSRDQGEKTMLMSRELLQRWRVSSFATLISSLFIEHFLGAGFYARPEVQRWTGHSLWALE